MLNCLYKIFEKIVLQRVLDFVEESNSINNDQFGFRKKQSTVHQIKRIINFIQNNKHIRRRTGIVVLDFEKAFDAI